jgi:hypothetical protein
MATSGEVSAIPGVPHEMLRPSMIAAAITPATAGTAAAKASRARPPRVAGVEILTLADVSHRAARREWAVDCRRFSSPPGRSFFEVQERALDQKP